MDIIPYQPDDLKEVYQLFYDTIHKVNVKDYTAKQLAVWAPEIPDWDKWQTRLTGAITFICRINDNIAGFGSLVDHTYLDFLYVSFQFQRRDVATNIYSKLEEISRSNGTNFITTDASITARPFFEKMGFKVLHKQSIRKKDIVLVNYKMLKRLTNYSDY